MGPRESDVVDLELIKESITLFGSSEGSNTSIMDTRLNHNNPSEIIDSYYFDRIKEAIDTDDDVKIMYYNSMYVSAFDDEVFSKSLCVNNPVLLDYINDKIECRAWLSGFVDVPSSVEVHEFVPSLSNINKIGISGDCFIVQTKTGSGGFGTYLVDSDEKILAEKGTYLISNYMHPSYSLNAHIIIDDRYVHKFPPSIQVIKNISGRMIFYGSDFIAAQRIDTAVRMKIDELCDRIGSRMRDLGYCGIAGIDFIVTSDEVYISEINPRFQSSSPLLNKCLKPYGVSLQLLNIMAFSGICPYYDFTNLEVSYSSFHYDFGYDEKKLEFKHDQLMNLIDVEVLDDGYDVIKNCYKEDESYAFLAIFNYNIVSINKFNSTFILENVCLDSLCGSLDDKIVEYKIALINQGISISKNALAVMDRDGIRKGVFNSIDIECNGFYINCPIGTNHSELSPYTLEYYADSYHLHHYGEELCKVVVFKPIDILERNLTKNNIPFDVIALVALDRLRIRCESTCRFKDLGQGCLFCEPFESAKSVEMADLYEVYDACSHLEYRHIMIGGGTGKDWKKILKITEYMHHKEPSTSISLMSIPPSVEKMMELKAAGITDVSFNIEIFDDDLAKEIMPGKGMISRETYYDRLQAAVAIFGLGNVRSIIVLGFESVPSLASGFERLCSLGIQPVLSVFRPIPGTKLELDVPPDNSWILDAYRCCAEICDKYGIRPGPDCRYCQNNVIAFPQCTPDH